MRKHVPCFRQWVYNCVSCQGEEKEEERDGEGRLKRSIPWSANGSFYYSHHKSQLGQFPVLLGCTCTQRWVPSVLDVTSIPVARFRFGYGKRTSGRRSRIQTAFGRKPPDSNVGPYVPRHTIIYELTKKFALQKHNKNNKIFCFIIIPERIKIVKNNKKISWTVATRLAFKPQEK